MKSIVIIGAGIIGCALAKELAEEGTDVHVVEKNHSFGEGVTSRNSGVIHAGLYYPPHSLKSQLCQEGRELLYHWCAQKLIPHKKTGKLVVATQLEDESWLKDLYRNALQSGVKENHLIPLTQHEIQKMSSHVKGVSALYALESGIVDVSALCHSFYVEAIKKSAQFYFDCEVREITHQKESYILHTTRGDISCDCVINAAGLYADEIARCVGIQKYTIYPWRGDYFKIKLPYLIEPLVYPVKKPKDSGLGIHLTINMQGDTFLGPDSEPAQSKEDFHAKPEKQLQFFEAAKRYLSNISFEILTYETCGIRPKLRSFSDKEEKDFIISEDLPGFFNLVGIESPGITASLAMARFVRKELDKKGQNM